MKTANQSKLLENLDLNSPKDVVSYRLILLAETLNYGVEDASLCIESIRNYSHNNRQFCEILEQVHKNCTLMKISVQYLLQANTGVEILQEEIVDDVQPALNKPKFR